MSRSRIAAFAAAFALMLCQTAGAVDGGTYSAFTPYSVYGIGEQYNPGTAYNWTMGGVGVASRNNRYINITNPASLTARDSLAFMSDFSLCQSNSIYRQGDSRSADNRFNMLDFAISFPLWHHSAMALGIKPFSATGYRITDYLQSNPQVISEVGNVADTYTGMGSVYEVFAGASVTLFKRLSLGVEGIWYFGNIEKDHTRQYSESAALTLTQNTDFQMNAAAAKFGLQYEQPLGNKLRMCLGATYRTSAGISGTLVNGHFNGNASIRTDTLSLTASSGPKISDELAVGISLNYMNRFRAELDYSHSDWTGSGFGNFEGLCGNPDVFAGCVSESYRIGFEYIPNPSDIRYYWKKVAYRAGAYYKTESFSAYGTPISSSAITAGLTLPVFRWYNGLTLGVEFGRRGSLRDNLVRETFVNFSIGVNLFDIWFQQHRYE